MKRLFDIISSSFLLLLFCLPMLLIFGAIKLTSKGNGIYWSNRVGRNKLIFEMPKFRTMNTEAPEVSTQVLKNAESYYTPLGKVLRKSSLDELPQLYSILKGDMTLIGPRPALYNQDELIKLRNDNKIYSLKPGLTGWAQVNGRDKLSIKEKVSFDIEYLQRKSFKFDCYIIWLTFLKVIKEDGISH